MNKYERVKAAIAGKPLDHVPSCYSIHFPRQEAFGGAAVKAHLDFYHETDVDVLKVMNENLVPAIGALDSPSDWDRLPAYNRSSQFVADQLELIKQLRDAEPDAYLLATVHGICASMIHPIEGTYGYQRGREILSEQARMKPAPYMEALKRVAAVLEELAAACVEAGCDGVYYAALGGEKRFYSEQEYASQIEPFDRQVMTAAKQAGGDVFLHICKDGLNMERYRSYADLCDVVNWGVYEVPFTIAEGKKLFPGKTIMGGLANRCGVLIEGTDEEVVKAVGDVISTAGMTGLIMGADCTLPAEIPYSRIRTAVEAARI